MHPFPLVDLSTIQFGPGLRGNSPGLCPVFIKNITRNSPQFIRKNGATFPNHQRTSAQNRNADQCNFGMDWFSLMPM